MKNSFIVLVILVLVWNLLVIYVDRKLEKTQNNEIYTNCNKIWTSRGLYTDFAKRNTVESMQKAFHDGAVGVEFDFHYDTQMKRFIVAHNYPKKNANGKLEYEKKHKGKLLTMDNFFKLLNDKTHYYWLDFKNLDKLNSQDTQDAIKRLLKITKEYNLKDRVYIEGSNPLKLSLYTDAGLKTIMGMRPLKDTDFFAPVVADAFKIVYHFMNISALAMAYGDEKNPYYGEIAEKGFKNIPIFLFHLPHKRELLEKIILKENVKVILTESLPSQVIKEKVNDINLCKE